MFEIIFSAIGTGILLSLFLIGPVFFLLIETSLTKGHRAALALDLGVIFADFICISFAYYGSQDIARYINNHPFLYKIGGLIVMIYGIFMILSKRNTKINKNELVTTNYYKIFINGFVLNIANVSVIAFWISTVFLIRSEFGNKNFQFFIFITVTLTTFILIDLYKIFLARLLKTKLTDELIKKIKKVMGLVLVAFGIIFLLKSFKLKFIEGIDKKIQKQIQLKDILITNLVYMKITKYKC